MTKSIKSLILFIALKLFTVSAFCQCEESLQVLWGLTNGNSVTVSHANYNLQNDLLVCGNTNSKGIIACFNGTSSVRWAKTYAFGSSVFFTKIISMSDGGIAVAGTCIDNGVSAVIIVRMDGTGNILWTKRLYDISTMPGLTNQFLLIRGLGETPDGGIAVCGRKTYRRADGNTNYRIYTFQLSSTGNVNWTREDTQGNDDEPYGLLIDQGAIVITGTTYSPASGIRYGFLEKLDVSNGNVTMLRRYKLENLQSNVFRSIEKNSTGYELGTQAFAFGLRLYNRLRVNAGGDQLECKLFPEMGPALADQYYYAVPLNDGSSILWRDWYYSSQDIELTKISNTNSIAWNYQYVHPGKQSISRVLPVGNSSVVAIGSSPDPALPNGRECIYLLKAGSDGITQGCNNTPLAITIKDSLTYSITSGIWQTTVLNFQAPLTISLTTQSVSLDSITLCQNNSCQPGSISIVGDTIICTPNAIVTYKLRTTGLCSIPAQWTLSSAIGNIISVNDSTIQIQYTQSGSGILKTNLISACSTYTSQVSIQYRPATFTFELGNDISFCIGDSANLSVNTLFNFVQWMNGSTSNTITANTGGEYSVSASEDGVCFQHDTIQVQVYPLPVISLPDDSVLCIPDTKLLNPGNGFQNYMWQDGSAQSTFLAKDTGLYWVKVTDMNSCKASDTTRITKLSQHPSEFAAFSDSAICIGEKIKLFLKENFVSYKWEFGQSTSPFFQTDVPGLYKIEVINIDGCTGSDTFSIKDKGCKMALYVPTAFTPNNDGENDTFKATAWGILDYFDFNVFNRWGEKVFYTNNITIGWNGNYKAVLQPLNAFVWIVRYRFIGNSTILMQKGTVNLIK